MVFGTVFPHGEVDFSDVAFTVIMAIVLQCTKIDVKFISRFIEKWQFKLLVHGVYLLLWIWVVFRYFFAPHERGLVLALYTLLIAPISEILLALLHWPISLIYSDVWITHIDTPKLYIELAISIISSFIVLELLLRLVRRTLIRSGRIEQASPEP
jgi:hypothetical protein